jgi:Flp pilus assembly protein TadB
MAVMVARILSALVGLAFIALTLVFFSLIVAIAVAAGLLLAALAWWRGTLKVEVRRGGRRGAVIEGEHRVIDQR